MSESSSPDRDESGAESIRSRSLVFADRGEKIAVTAGGRPALPEVTVTNRYYPEIEEFLQAAISTLGVKLTLLRCLDDGDVEKGKPRLYSLVTTRSDDGLSDGLRWMESVEIDRIEGLCDSQISSIRLERDRVSGQTPDSPVVPWEWLGQWDRDAQEWIGSHLGSRVVQCQWSATPVRSWSISSVARISVGPAGVGERLYFKASPSFFSNEAAVTAAVADRFPEVSPRLAAVDRTRGWMLMEDLGEITLEAIDSADLWREVMRALARIQIEFASDLSSLDRLGLKRRSTSAISCTLRQWTQNSHDLGLRYAARRTHSALVRLGPHLELVDRLCERIDSVGLPPTLDHGDLDAGNIFVRGDSPVIMDWSDASVSNPLFAPVLIPQVSREPLLAGAFLAEWTEFAEIDSLEEAFEVARPIAALERAFHYHSNIVAHLTYPSIDRRVLEEYIPDLLNLAASSLEKCA